MRPCSSGLVRIADSCCGAADCMGHKHTHTHTCTHNSSERGQGRVIAALIKPPQDKAVLRNLAMEKGPEPEPAL